MTLDQHPRQHGWVHAYENWETVATAETSAPMALLEKLKGRATNAIPPSPTANATAAHPCLKGLPKSGIKSPTMQGTILDAFGALECGDEYFEFEPLDLGASYLAGNTAEIEVAPVVMQHIEQKAERKKKSKSKRR